MSKTLGNTITIDETFTKFGADGTRYLLMSAGIFGEDVDLTMERMIEKYNSDLANGLGNLVSRVLKLAEKLTTSNAPILPSDKQPVADQMRESFVGLLDDCKFSEALEYIWNIIRTDDKYIDDNKPWALAKNNPKKFEQVMKKLLVDLAIIAELLVPFLPGTSGKIKDAIKSGKTEPLFQRIK